MDSRQPSAWKRFILWDYPRASWQYDVIVILILLFIFATPRSLFRDQPRGRDVVMLPSAEGNNVFWLEPDLLNDVPETERYVRAAELLKGRIGRKPALVRVEPIFDQGQEVVGYMAFTKP